VFLSPPWPYLLSLPAALLLGILFGWMLHTIRGSRKPRTTDSQLSGIQAKIKQREESLHTAEIELAHHESRLQTLNKTIATTRQQVEESEEEHNQLLVILDEWQASIKNSQDSLHTIRQGLQARSQEANDLLANIDKSLEEMDLLKKMQESYQVKTNRLTQQVQWQDSELRMLRHTVQSKTSELNEARSLLEQRDAELRLLIRQRQQREIDIANARKGLAQRDEELKRLLKREGESAFETGRPLTSRPLPELTQSRAEQPVDVTPRPAPVLPASRPDISDDTHSAAADEGNQDIIVIPRLADYYARQLRAKGISTVGQLACHTPEELRAMLEIPSHHSPQIENWIKTARRLSRQKKTSES
jgi:hypothetical protein